MAFQGTKETKETMDRMGLAFDVDVVYQLIERKEHKNQMVVEGEYQQRVLNHCCATDYELCTECIMGVFVD